MKRIISIITLIVAVCSGAWAQTDRIAFGTISNGTVTPDNANPPAGAATVTLTVTPATGYYITVSDITVTRTALGAQGRTRTPDLDGTTYPVTAVSVDAIGKGTYSFNVENGYGAYVEVAFTACTAITPVVNITGWTYGAAANAPSVTGNPGNGTVTYDYKVKGAADGTYQATVPTEAGDYTVRATIAAAGHYLGNTATKDFTIAKAAITAVTLDNTTLTYTGKAQTVNVTAVKAGTLDVPAAAYTVSGNTQTTVGDYTVRVTANDDSNYSGYAEAQFSIIPEGASTFEVSGIADSYVYTGSEIRPVPTVKEGTSVLTENTDYTLAYTGNVNVGTATITVTGIGGYSGTKTVTFAITPKPVTVIADGKEKTYGEADPALTYTAAGLVGTDALTGDLARESGEGAGTYAITQGTLSASANYTINYTGATLTIAKALLTVTAKDKSIDYGGEASNDGVSYSGFVNGETAGVLGGTLTFSYNSKADGTGDAYTTSSPKGTYYIIPGGLTSSNYTITFKSGILNVGGKILVIGGDDDPTATAKIVVTPAEFTYNGKDQKPTVKLVMKSDNSEIPSSEYSVGYRQGDADITESVNAGSYSVVISGKVGSNYSFSGNTTAGYVINMKSLFITADAVSKTYGETDPVLTYTVTGLVGTDVMTGDLSREDGEDVGTYAITQGTLAATANYIINYTGADLTINKRAVTVSGITAHDKNYDGTTAATLVLSNAVFEGLVAGDNLTVAATGAFEDAEVGNNKTVIISGLTLGGTSVGNYVLADAGNQTTTTASILPVGTIDRKHSGIEVRRNDTNELVDNDAYLTLMPDGTLRIDHVDIVKPADATAENPVSVSVYIPATLKDYDGTTGNIYGVGNDIIVTDGSVPVTDVYMPETEEIINVSSHAFRLDETESTTAWIHTSLPLLDDYALCIGLKAEYEAGKVMTTVKPTTHYWTFSSGVDIVMPESLTAYVCQADGLSAVAARAIKETTTNVEGKDRIIVKANNGVMMGGDLDGYNLRAWPSADRPTGMTPPTEDAHSYEDNELVPATITTHFIPTEYYILYSNTFHELQPTDNTSVSPCKAVLRKSNPSMARSLGISVDNESAGINTIWYGADAVDEKWYTIDGQKLDGKPTKNGLYIRNGVKVIIK